MPTYEYQCPNCGVFEQFHSISTSLTHCPTCSQPVKRLISQNSNIIFKGSGFHITDYRSGDYQKKAATENPGGGAASSASSSSPAAGSQTANSQTAGSETASSSKVETKAS